LRKKLLRENTSTQFIKFLTLTGIICALYSCRERELDPKPERVKNKKTEELVLVLDSLTELRPNHLYTKIKTTYADTNQTVSFKTSLRITKDSVVSALITKANIPVAHALVRPDSVLIGNKIANCFIKKDLSYFKEAFGVDFSYRDIEQLMLGLPIGFDTTQTYFQINDNDQYIISSKKKRQVKRFLKEDKDKDRDKDKDKDRDKEKDKERDRDREDRDRDRHNRRDDDQDIIIQYYLNGNLSALNRIFIDSPQDTTSINIQYQTRDSVENYLIPHDVIIEIKTPRNNVYIELRYDKTEVNKPEEIVFVIPEDYEECRTKQDE